MAAEKISVWIPGNQLLDSHPALQRADKRVERNRLSVLLIENRGLIENRASHPLKLILILSAMRHYAEELSGAGYEVDYRSADSFTVGIREHIKEQQPHQIITMEASDFRGRQLQQSDLPRQLNTPLEVLPNTQFLVGQHDPYAQADPQKNVLLEYFYRRMRRHFQILLDEEGNPLGGDWNYDSQNRQPLPADIHSPSPQTFPPDRITHQVMEDYVPEAKARLDFQLAVTRGQAQQALEDFIQQRLPNFGAYEDAMTGRSSLLFHSRLSPYLNLGLLQPLDVIRRAESAYKDGAAPINSVEGFIRQVLGWREYIYWQYWRKMPDLEERNYLEADRPLPAFFWSGNTGMNCLRTVLHRVRASGYCHHIERLMILSNFFTLTGVRPREVLNWFMASYLDAYPWVMVPNVIGMGLHADGGGVGTKPYVSSANYIHRMSDYCSDCRYQQGKRSGENACPYNFLYWNFLLTRQKKLENNPRMALSLSNLRHLEEDERRMVRKQSQQFLDRITMEKDPKK